jgi:secondary thiamine-phosphate synthase enzyme
MPWMQTRLRLRPRARGMHLVTDEIVAALPDVRRLRVGLVHLFLQHTSAALFLNENADPDVRTDLERWTREQVPDGAGYFVHTTEGDDDMPAHVKSGLFGASLVIPVHEGRLALGTWQGIYLGEHREDGGARSVVATVWGEE